MIARYLLAALAAGLLAGLLITPVQYARVLPLILHAEEFEAAGADAHRHGHGASSAATPAAGFGEGRLVLAHLSGKGAEPQAGEPEARLFGTRLAGMILANLVAGAGFALILAAVSLMLGVPVTRANGALWGLAGFAVFGLAPSVGLAPELPAMPAADLALRQTWWIAAAAFTALGAYALILRREPWTKALGVAAIALPQVWGAPEAADLASPIPPTLAAEFAVASLATGVVFWLLLGLAAGEAFDRLGRRDAVSGAA